MTDSESAVGSADLAYRPQCFGQLRTPVRSALTRCKCQFTAAATARRPALRSPCDTRGHPIRRRLPTILTALTMVAPDRNGGASAHVRIVLADDHAIVRGALRRLLEAREGFEVVAEAGDVPAAVRKVLGHKPDLLLLDLNMPGGSSLAAIPALRSASPRTAVVILTMQNEPEPARTAFRTGALGFVLKEQAEHELEDAISAVLDGHPYLNPEIGGRIAVESEPAPKLRDQLSDGELEVLRLVALGYTTVDIANELCLSVRTVEARRSRVRRKIRRPTRSAMVAYAYEQGLLDGPGPDPGGRADATARPEAPSDPQRVTALRS